MAITKHQRERLLTTTMRTDTRRPRPLTEAELDEHIAARRARDGQAPAPAEAATDLGAHVGDTDFAAEADRAHRRGRAWELLAVALIIAAALGGAIALLAGPRP